MKSNKKTLLWLSAGIYAAGMLALLLLRASKGSALPYSAQLKTHFNLVPFRTIRLFLRSLMPPRRPHLVRHAIINLLGNVLMFIPLGLLPPTLWQWPRRLWKTLLLSAGIVAAIELLQMLLLVGTCDVDDLILNLTGAAIGYGIYALFRRRNAKKELSP